MGTDTGKKSSKGTVSVEEFQGRLRLRWRHEGKRYVLAIGLPDSKVNRDRRGAEGDHDRTRSGGR